MHEIYKNDSQAVDSEDLLGYVQGFTVGNFVQMLEIEEKTCTLHIRSKKRHGVMYFQEGVMLNAQTEDLDGEPAAYDILSWDEAQLKLEDACHQKEKIIRSSLTRMILEATKRKDESDYNQDKFLNLKRAIRLAKGHHFKEAHRLIGTYLKKNPKSSEAWLWYSRCLNKVDIITAALKKCGQYAKPDDAISTELKKIEQAAGLIDGLVVRRCPFCWSPIARESDNCHYCKASLTISKALLEETLERVDSKLLIEAVTQYTDVVAHENNIKATFFLCLANCNLNKVEEALDLLNEATRINPENKFLADQLNLLITKVATRLNRYESIEAETNGTQKKHAIKNTNAVKKILVVDDSPTTRKVVVLTLKQKGYTIVEAQDGLEALSKIDEERPDLILLDIILPKMDGYKILSIIKENKDFKDTPVIMLTSKDGIINKVKGKLAGSAAYLTKPFQPKELLETVGKHI
jgi:twitching motility two-component system response regulator PilG